MSAELEAAPTTPLGVAHANLATIVTFQREFMQTHVSVDNRRYVADLLTSGFVTASETTCRIARIAAELGAPNIARATTASYPLVLQLAAMPLENALLLTQDADVWNARNFEAHRRRPSVNLRKEFHEQLVRKRGLSIDSVNSDTTGCPAKVALGAGNPLNELVTMMGRCAAAVLDRAARGPPNDTCATKR